MKKSKLTTLCILLIVAALLFACVPLAPTVKLLAANPNYSSEIHSFTAPVQEKKQFTSKSLTIENPTFDSGTVSTFNEYVDGWTSSTGSNVIAGVLDTTNFDTFKTDKNLSKIDFLSVNPLSLTTSNVLVMTNKTSTGTASANYTQSLGEFYADGFFEIKVNFYAVKSTNAIYLTPSESFDDDRANPSINVTQSTNEYMSENESIWRTATFLVKTDTHTGMNLNLQLCLGKQGGIASGGVVYYDNVQVTAYSWAQFKTKWDNAQNADNLTCAVDLTASETHKSQTGIYENFNSEATSFKTIKSHMPAGTQLQPYTPISSLATRLNLETVDTVHGNGNFNNSGVMMLTAENATGGVKYASPFTVQRHIPYMLSFYSLGAENAYIRIRDVRSDEKNLPSYISLYSSDFLAIESGTTSSSDSRNGWTLNTVFIVGETMQDTDVNIEFWVGQDSATTGYILIDDFSIVPVSHAHYEKLKANANTLDCNLSTLDATSTIENAYFNLGSTRTSAIAGTSSAYPLIASSWTVTLEGTEVTAHADETKIINGIVNTDTVNWTRNNILINNGKAYGMAINPGKIRSGSSNNNIYMLQNTNRTYQKVTSSSVPLSSDSDNIISFDACRIKTDDTINFWAMIEIDGREVARIDLSEPFNSANVTGWKNYAFAIKTSKFSGPNITLSFLLGDSENKTTGIGFVDNISVEQNQTSKTVNTEIDLNDPSKLADINGNSLFFIPENTDDAYARVINNTLAINTTKLCHTKITNTLTEQINSDTAYEYVVKAYIGHIAYGDDYDTDNNPDWGVSFKLKGMDGGFINLKQQSMETMAVDNIDGVNYIDLIFYIKTGTQADLALVIEFGSEEVNVEGSVAIKQTSLTEISMEKFNSVKETDNFKIIKNATSTEESENPATDSTQKTNLDWLIIPSIITSIAILVALGGFLFRRFKFQIHIGKRHTSYALDDHQTKIKKPKSIKATKSARTKINETKAAPENDEEQ